MLSMISNQFGSLLKTIALKTGLLAKWYCLYCQPSGQEWAIFLKRHGELYQMGEDCVIQINVNIVDPAHIRLGNRVRLTGCTLLGHDDAVNMVKKMTGLALDNSGKIDIFDDVFIGHQAVIMPGVSIGPNAIVAAGAVVIQDVLANTIVGGVPAKTIGTVEDYLLRCKQKTVSLPWFGHPLIAGDYFGPASAELTKLRCVHFFGNPAPENDQHSIN
jgi:acetyltransferase-like isoleucine patch superfamily enzyme